MQGRLIIPRAGLEPVEIELVRSKLHITSFGAEFVKERYRRSKAIAGGSGQFSAWMEQAILNHATGQDNASWGNLSPVYLALCTVVPTSSSTGSTITEATYTGYGRTSVANTAWNAASGTAPATSTNSGTITGAACSGSTSTIIAGALCTASTLGNVIVWFSVPSTVISTTQTPPTVGPSALSVTQT